MTQETVAVLKSSKDILFSRVFTRYITRVQRFVIIVSQQRGEDESIEGGAINFIVTSQDYRCKEVGEILFHPSPIIKSYCSEWILSLQV